MRGDNRKSALAVALLAGTACAIQLDIHDEREFLLQVVSWLVHEVSH